MQINRRHWLRTVAAVGALFGLNRLAGAKVVTREMARTHVNAGPQTLTVAELLDAAGPGLGIYMGLDLYDTRIAAKAFGIPVPTSIAALVQPGQPEAIHALAQRIQAAPDKASFAMPNRAAVRPLPDVRTIEVVSRQLSGAGISSVSLNHALHAATFSLGA